MKNIAQTPINENRRSFLKRGLIGAGVLLAASQTNILSKPSREDKIELILARAAEAKMLYDTGTESEKAAMIEGLYKDYEATDKEKLKDFILHFGAFLVNG